VRYRTQAPSATSAGNRTETIIAAIQAEPTTEGNPQELTEASRRPGGCSGEVTRKGTDKARPYAAVSTPRSGKPLSY
jgi:hypothetical protein